MPGRIKRFLCEYKLLFLAVGISIAVFWRWFAFPLLTFADLYFYFPETMKDWFGMPHIWDGHSRTGTVNLILAFWWYRIFYGGFALWGVHSAIADKFILMFPILVAAPISMYALVRHLRFSHPSAFIAAIVFTFNSSLLVAKTNHLALALTFSLMPLVLVLFMKAVGQTDFRYAFSAGMAGFIMSAYDFRMFYVMVWVLLCYALFYVVYQPALKRKDRWNAAAILALVVLLPLSLNLYWIFGMIATGSLVSNPLVDRSLFGGQFVNVLRGLTLFHPYWAGTRAAIFEITPIPIYLYCLTVCVFAGWWLHRNNYKILFLGFITLAGVFFTKLNNPPFVGVYAWLHQNLPGFNAFRESTKFYSLIALGYIPLLAAFADTLYVKREKTGKWKYLFPLFFVCVVSVFLWSSRGIITGTARSIFIPREIPHDYLVFKEFVESDKSFFRVLSVPNDIRWIVKNNNHPLIAMKYAYEKVWQTIYPEEDMPEEEFNVKIFQQENFNELLDRSSVRYIVLPFLSPDPEISISTDQAYYSTVFDQLDYLQRVDIGTKDLIVYENSYYLPHFYLAPESPGLETDLAYRQVDYRQVNPTRYEIRVNNLETSTYLHFSELYDEGWSSRVGPFSWVSTLYEKDYFLEDGGHEQTDALTNSFYLDKDYLVAHFKGKGVVVNDDGTIDVDLVVYYRPQSFVYLGLLAGAAAMVVSVIFVIFTRSRYGKIFAKG